MVLRSLGDRNHWFVLVMPAIQQHTPTTIAVRGMKVGLDEHLCTLANVKFILADDACAKQGIQFGLFVNGEAYSKSVLKWPKERRICALVESPINPCYRDPAELERRFPLILTHRQELVRRGPPYRELLFGTSWIGLSSVGAVEDIEKEHPAKSSLVSFIGSIQHASTGAYQFRQDVASAMLQRSDVDCYGKGIREISGKREALESYSFSIAMENAAEDLYFSEKLVDCILLETVPIYYGCPGIGKLLNTAGLLQFRTLEELNGILSRVDQSLWLQMRPAVLENKQRILNNGWYSHRSLLNRIAAEWLTTVPAELLETPCQFRGRVANLATAISDRVHSLLRWN